MPDHIERIALALLRKHPGWSMQRAIATAISTEKRWAASGRVHQFKGNPRIRGFKMPAIVAGAARWQAMKGKGK